MSKLFFLIFLSVALISCDGGTSSNTETKKIEASTVTDSSGTTVTTNGTVIRLNPGGTPEIIEDPNGDASVIQNPDGSFTVTSSGGTTVFSADGSIINQPNLE
ncbi:MAG: hypothetical protein KI793_14160 [Rivularia sp. (in: Bacteria)]|nr:hypothetical protein [Rivularia sp. MS3]